MSQYHVAIAAEAYAAALFARLGCDVLVQYGTAQPEYDLVISRAGKVLRVSVKGSQNGKWGLTQSYLQGANYHGAVNKWLSKCHENTLFCLVQFKDVGPCQLPSMYLAWPKEIAQRLKETARGRGSAIFYEHIEWSSRAHAVGTIDRIPEAWRFTAERLDEVLQATFQVTSPNGGLM